MDINHIRDFYALQSIVAHESQMPDLAGKARAEIAVFAPDLAQALLDYMFLISVGEARHANEFALGWYWSEIRRDGRLSAYKQALGWSPTKVLPQLAEVFSLPGWGSSYGGKRWATICDTTRKLWAGVPPNTVIDHIVDLQHNGGQAFNKSEVKNVIDFDISTWDCTYVNINSFLDIKRNKDLLTLNDLEVSRYVHSLSFKAGRLYIAARQRLGLETNIVVHSKPSYQAVVWGDGELTEKQDTDKPAKKTPTYSASPNPSSGDTSSKYLSEDELYEPPSAKGSVTQLTCEKCGSDFDAGTGTDCDGHYFCSEDCHTAWHDSEYTCAQCGCHFNAEEDGSESDKDGNVFCSETCKMEYHSDDEEHNDEPQAKEEKPTPFSEWLKEYSHGK